VFVDDPVATSADGLRFMSLSPLDRRRAGRLACALVLCAPACWQLLLELQLFAARVRYPMDLEWLEGPALYQAYRVMHGLATYGPPEQGYLPLFHPPGFPVILSLVGRVFGLDYAVGRSLSFAAFVVCCALVLRAIGRHETAPLHRVVTGLLAIGFAAAGAPLVSGFYDLVREDMVALSLSVLGAALADTDRRRMGPWRIALLSFVLTASVFTRATAVFFAAWTVLYVFARHRRSGLLLALSSLSMGAVALVYVQLQSRGWYWMYTVTINQVHQTYRDRFVEGLRFLHAHAPFAVALVPIAVVLAARRRLSARTVLWLGMAASALPASLLPYAKRGGFFNDFVPFVFLIGPAAALLLVDCVRALGRIGRLSRLATTARWALYAAASALLVVRAREPRESRDHRRLAPTADNWRRAEALNRRVASLKGGVIAPRAPFLPVRNGDRTEQFSDMPYLDLIWANFPGSDVGPYLDHIGAQWALVSGVEVTPTAIQIAQRYQLEEPIADPPELLLGDDVALHYVLRKKEDESGARVVFDFEKPLDGWTRLGDAFARSPTVPNPSWQQTIVGAVGSGVANSYHPDKKDSATGTLLSPPFVVDRPRMGLSIGGGWGNGTRVELRADGRTVHTAHPVFQSTEAMIRVAWDVSALRGHSAQLAIIDEDRGDWGHITCDQVVLY
jgi:hypothetical protein